MSTRVQAIGKHTEGAASSTLAFASPVQAGNLIVVMVGKQNWTSSDPFAAGDCTQSAGTATIGAVALDVAREGNEASAYWNVGIFSIPVTGAGTCTIQLAGAPADSYWVWSITEYTGIDVTGTRLEDSDYGAGTGTAPATANVTCAGGAVICGMESENVSATCTHTEDGAFSLIYELDTGSTTATGSFIERIVSSGVTDAASWTIGLSAGWLAVAAVYKATIPSATAALTGTLADGATRDEVFLGEQTAILTLTGDTYVAAGGTFDAQRQALIDGGAAAAAQARGWSAQVRAVQPVTVAVRTSATVATLTLVPASGYWINEPETITWTVPASILTGAAAIVAMPSFTVTPSARRILRPLAHSQRA